MAVSPNEIVVEEDMIFVLVGLTSVARSESHRCLVELDLVSEVPAKFVEGAKEEFEGFEMRSRVELALDWVQQAEQMVVTPKWQRIERFDPSNTHGPPLVADSRQPNELTPPLPGPFRSQGRYKPGGFAMFWPLDPEDAKHPDGKVVAEIGTMVKWCWGGAPADTPRRGERIETTSLPSLHALSLPAVVGFSWTVEQVAGDLATLRGSWTLEAVPGRPQLQLVGGEGVAVWDSGIQAFRERTVTLTYRNGPEPDATTLRVKETMRTTTP